MYTPYPYQIEAVDSIFHYYASGNNGNPICCMPTATGKSLVMAEFIKRVLQRWTRQRIMLSTHVKELIVQNAEKLRSQWPEVPLGIFSAGLGQRDTLFPVIYAGVASAVNCVELFGWRDLLLVDEAHLISPKDDSNYQFLIAALKKINPNLKVIGFTATPYRLGQGMLTDDGLFTDICFDLCSLENFNKLIDGGYIVTPIPRAMTTELDVTGVKMTGGDFNKDQLQTAVDKDDITYAACKEIVKEGSDRICWLIFASGIKHAEHIADCLEALGIETTFIHSKLGDKECDRRLKAWKAGEYRAIVNYGKLTTGIDHPPIDLIAILRPTTSTVLWVQMLGRGIRTSPATHKENCLVLDFARNSERLGPINDPVIPRKRKKGDEPGVAPIRLCPSCGVYNHARAVTCFMCGFVFPKTNKLTTTAATHELVRRDEVAPIVQVHDVQRMLYHYVIKPGKKPMMRVQYFCGPQGLAMFSEYVCFEHGGYAQRLAHTWWKERMGVPVAPPNTAEAMKWASRLRQPKRLKVWVNKKYPEVMGYEW